MTVRSYLTIFPFVNVSGQRDIWLLPPELELAAIGFANGFFCKSVDGVDVPVRAANSVSFSLVAEAGLVAICRLDDECDDLNDAMIAAFSAGDGTGRQVVMGADLAELSANLATRTVQLAGQIGSDDLAVLRAELTASNFDPSVPDFMAFRDWVLACIDSPSSASCVRPGIFTSLNQSFASRAQAALVVQARVAVAPQGFEARGILIAELAMLQGVRVTLDELIAAQ